ncbi:hypothetical protein BIW11_04341 [Tropilaelaps mercedesae]|uniref:Uncharacterized protein n=1 Tax=Tropilaelaps mercedesae TaxID=418985 RepID=A0A1V9X852_9ACAR|nr:hypothetical protein BIW11_04341 [Tropilaelaps mercedesae]
MDKLDSALRQQLVQQGYDFRALSSYSTIIKTLLRDVTYLKGQTTDIDKLIQENTEFSQNTMLYRIQLDENKAELEGLKRASAEERKALQEHIDFLERTVPQIKDLPRSKVLQQIWGTNITKEHLSLLQYADRHLHELQETNRKLTQDLDKQFLQTSSFLLKIKVRDNELQRLTALINSGKVRHTMARPEASGAGLQLKLLHEKNTELERTAERPRQVSSKTVSGSAIPELDLRKLLELAETARKELAEQVVRLNGKNTSLQGVVARYEYELRIVRLERDDILRQLQEYQQKESMAAARVPIDESNYRSSRHRLPPESLTTEPKEAEVLDENGNDAGYSVNEMPRERQRRNQASDQYKPTSDRDACLLVSKDASYTGEMLIEKVAQYERNYVRLSENLRMLREAVTKKDIEIVSLRSQVALIACAHEENASLHEDLAQLKAKSREYKMEIYKLRQEIRNYTAEAAKAAEIAAASNECGRTTAPVTVRPTATREGRAEMVSTNPEMPPVEPVSSLVSAVDQPACSSSAGAPPTETQMSRAIGVSDIAQTHRERAAVNHQTATTNGAGAGAHEKVALLQRNVAELTASLRAKGCPALQVRQGGGDGLYIAPNISILLRVRSLEVGIYPRKEELENSDCAAKSVNNNLCRFADVLLQRFALNGCRTSDIG